MSDEQRLEARLREFAALPADGADWNDVRRRAGVRLPVGLHRRRLILAVAAALAVAASVVGILVPSLTRSARPPRGSVGPTGAAAPKAAIKGPTGLHGPTGRTGATGYVGPTGRKGPTGGSNPLPLALRDLKEASKQLAEPIYWAGPRAGEGFLSYFRHAGNWIVAYRPVRADDTVAGRYRPVVATYPWFPGAFAALKKQAGGKAVAGPDGSIIYVNPHDPTSLLMAFPGVDYQVEIHDPRPGVALTVAESGDVRPVG